MPNKTEEYLALACKTADSFSRQWEHWAEFLITASRLYKYSYPDQLMIYAQRPDATACADFDIWNNRMNRYVRRGAKGIALLDESSGFPRLHYVFDVSDTGVRRNSRDPEVWQLGPDLVQPVSEMLAATYGISGERVSQQLADVAGKLVADYWDNNGGDIRAIVDGSLLMDYDEAGVEMQFKSAAAISVTYTLLERCGFEPAGWFDKDDFQAIYNFSTPDSVYALGAAVSDMSREVLRNIERTVKTTIRRRNIERSQEEYEQQSELHEDRGLFSAEPDLESAPEAAEPVRKDAPELSDGAAPGGVQHDAAERDPVPAITSCTGKMIYTLPCPSNHPFLADSPMRSSKMLYRVFASVFSQLAREIIGHFASVENAQILKQYIVLPKAAAKDEIFFGFTWRFCLFSDFSV